MNPGVVRTLGQHHIVFLEDLGRCEAETSGRQIGFPVFDTSQAQRLKRKKDTRMLQTKFTTIDSIDETGSMRHLERKW